MLRATARRCTTSTISDLQAAFRDPKSPYHIAPGERGPASPDEPVGEYLTPGQRARRALVEMGYDCELFWEQQVVWGDHDSFQHVNNVRYVRFVESARIHFLSQLGKRIGGESKAADMRNGKGVSLILKSITVDYKRPVTYPDTLLMATKPSLIYPQGRDSDSDFAKPSPSRTMFNLNSVAYSYAQQCIVTKAQDTTVWYDYDKLKKCDPGDECWRVLGDMIQGDTKASS